jgi:hypothetical protein
MHDAPTGQPNNPTAPNDAGGTPGTIGDIGPLPAIERAAAVAVEQHLSEARGRGKRGPDKRTRRTRAVPLAPMGNGAADPFVAENPAVPLSPGWDDAPPTFDEEVAQSLIDVAVGLLNDGAAAVIRAVAKKETGDDVLAAEAAASVRMPEKIEAAVKKGAMECAKKYAVRLDYAPEVMLGGGLLIWAGQVVIVKKSLAEKGRALRETGQRMAA